MILGMGLEMPGELIDALSQQGDLNFRGARVSRLGRVVLDDDNFLFF